MDLLGSLPGPDGWPKQINLKSYRGKGCWESFTTLCPSACNSHASCYLHCFLHSTSPQCWYVKFKWRQLEAIFKWGICLTSSYCDDALPCPWLISQWNQNEFLLSWVGNWVNWRGVAHNGGERNKVIEEYLGKILLLFTLLLAVEAVCGEIGSVKVVTRKRQI